jgi:hypothetical protein
MSFYTIFGDPVCSKCRAFSVIQYDAGRHRVPYLPVICNYCIADREYDIKQEGNGMSDKPYNEDRISDKDAEIESLRRALKNEARCSYHGCRFYKLGEPSKCWCCDERDRNQAEVEKLRGEVAWLLASADADALVITQAGRDQEHLRVENAGLRQQMANVASYCRDMACRCPLPVVEWFVGAAKMLELVLGQKN